MKLHTPAMKFREGMEPEWEKGLANNEDPYGRACYRFASEWATRMEQAMEGGKESVAECMKRCSHEADDEGITGFMFGCAVAILSACWLYGEELRVAHNLGFQIGDEGEKANKEGKVINPALLCIG